MGGITIKSASWSLGMHPSIEFSINPGIPTYRVLFSTSNFISPFTIEKRETDRSAWERIEGTITRDDIVALLPDRFHWNWVAFEAMWEGFAEGYDKGYNKGFEEGYKGGAAGSR